LQLLRRILNRLAALDPEPADIEATLTRIVEELGPPTGPTRALATAVRDDWETACANPGWVEHLLAEATGASLRDKEAKPRGPQVHS
jgi:hypothetical protein